MKRPHFVWAFCVSSLLGLLACGPQLPREVEEAYADLPQQIDFNFHVRPILSDRCFHCHGPDENAREADLRLDLEESAFAALKESGGKAFVHGKAAKSMAIQRVLSDDPDDLMPPPESNLQLTAREKATLVKWVEQGAKWKPHWAFIPPRKPQLPRLQASEWTAHNPIDRFVLKRVEQAGLTPSPEADKERLLRRVTLDLTGLPPTLEEMEAFLANDSPEAYERVVDRLLQSDACAERLTMEWMDVARYADSHGMHADGWRLMWPWRDWVIQAFKDNMPYDAFVSWQLAGDLMPEASRDQKLATAFHRNHPMTAEGGVIDEEFRLGYVFDRTETTGTAFLGMTLNCARCHDHKFDPISQKDYYQFTAFFNHVKELGMTGDDGNYGPHLLLADEGTERELQQLKTAFREQSQALSMTQEEVSQTLELIKQLSPGAYQRYRVGYFPLDRLSPAPKGRQYVDGNAKSSTPGKPRLVEGIQGQALEFTGNYDELYLEEQGLIELYDPLSVGLWINTTKKEEGKTQVLIGNAGQKNNFWRGWDFYLDDQNRVSVRLIHSLPHNYVHLRSIDSIALNTWTHLAFTYDGTGRAAGLKLYLDGKPAEAEVVYDKLYKSIYPVASAVHTPEDRSLRVARSYRAFTGEGGVFKGKMDEIELFASALTELEVAQMVERVSKSPLEPEEDLLRTHWAQRSPRVQGLLSKLRELRKQWLETVKPVKEVMVMEDMPEKRATFAYERGEYDSPMYEVSEGTPEVIMPFPESYPDNRLGLSQWLFHPDNPLTARVTVNRYWQMIFGRGLVKTPQDFGVQGDLPSHPALLDWLAVDFVEHGWDLKYLLKQMVMSATYRQASALRPELREKDPENVLLARGATYRLPAEMIRDNALAASGLLVQQVGGKSVRPYQPEGLWIEKGNFSHILLRYKESQGDSLYRRSLYTFIRRTSPHPAMTAFDAPNRDVCTVKRENTNTPLQALVLLNDPQFVEASRVLAERMQTEGGDALHARITFAFRLATGRKPKAEEVRLLEELYQKQYARYQEDPEAAKDLLEVGESPVNPELDPQQTAALTMLCSTMLNHDEAYMKR